MNNAEIQRIKEDEFEKCTIANSYDGGFQIKCKLGLWSVAGRHLDSLKIEAKHYFEQYKSDGEYHKILGGASPLQIIFNQRNDTPHPLVDQCKLNDATGIFDLARRLEEKTQQLERSKQTLKELCERMTDEIDGLTDEDIRSIAESISQDSEKAFTYVKFLMGLYHNEKSVAASWRLRFEQLEANNGRDLRR